MAGGVRVLVVPCVLALLVCALAPQGVAARRRESKFGKTSVTSNSRPSSAGAMAAADGSTDTGKIGRAWENELAPIIEARVTQGEKERRVRDVGASLQRAAGGDTMVQARVHSMIANAYFHVHAHFAWMDEYEALQGALVAAGKDPLHDPFADVGAATDDLMVARLGKWCILTGARYGRCQEHLANAIKLWRQRGRTREVSHAKRILEGGADGAAGMDADSLDVYRGWKKLLFSLRSVRGTALEQAELARTIQMRDAVIEVARKYSNHHLEWEISVHAGRAHYLLHQLGKATPLFQNALAVEPEHVLSAAFGLACVCVTLNEPLDGCEVAVGRYLTAVRDAMMPDVWSAEELVASDAAQDYWTEHYEYAGGVSWFTLVVAGAVAALGAWMWKQRKSSDKGDAGARVRKAMRKRK